MITEKKILFCSTVLNTIQAFLLPHIALLRRMGYQVDVAANRNGQDLGDFGGKYYDLPFSRKPWSWANFSAANQLKKIVEENRYQAVHFHTPVAGAFGRWAVQGLRQQGLKVFYTAHGFHFQAGGAWTGWLVYYPIERFLSAYTDVLITINAEDYTRALTFAGERVVKMPGVGVVLHKEQRTDREIFRQKLGLAPTDIMLLSVGELNRNKNHVVVLNAIKQLSNNRIHYFICGEGKEQKHLLKTAQDLGLSQRIHLEGYQVNVSDYYCAADLFVFPSFREGLPVSVMEAMAFGLPIAGASIRGVHDLLVEDRNGRLFQPSDPTGVAHAISATLSKKTEYSSNNQIDVKIYQIEHVLPRMEFFYQNILS